MKSENIFVVTMYRYGNFDSHNYLLCITDNYSLAEIYEEAEMYNRGKKYYGEIVKRKINETKKFEVVRSLEEHPDFK